MRKIVLSALTLVAASTALSGCGPSLPKLSVCKGQKYRYANPNGVSLPSLDVPSPVDIDGAAAPGATPAAPASKDPFQAVAPQPDGASPPASAPDGNSAAPAAPAAKGAVPVASPPKRGAMYIPPAGALIRSC